MTFAATNGTAKSGVGHYGCARARLDRGHTRSAAVGIGTVSATVAGLPVATANLTINAAVPLPIIRALVNGASFTPDVSPGSWITLFIENNCHRHRTVLCGPSTACAGWGTGFWCNGAAIPMYLVSPQQVKKCPTSLAMKRLPAPHKPSLRSMAALRPVRLHREAGRSRHIRIRQ